MNKIITGLNWCNSIIEIYFLSKRLFFIAIISLILSLETNLSAQESKVWDYPVHYGTAEWERLNTSNEKTYAYNIPDSVLENMNTKDLVESCLNYPDIILIMSRDNIQLGYNYLKRIFNGFQELENRRNAGGELIKIYQKINPEEIMNLITPDNRGVFFLKLTFTELLLAQKSILQNLKDDEIVHLLSLTNSVYEKKSSEMKYYAKFGITTPCLIIGRLFEIHNPELYARLISNNPHIHVFLNETIVAEKDDLDQIIMASKEYLQTKRYE